MSTTHKSTHGFAEVAGTRLYYEIAGEELPGTQKLVPPAFGRLVEIRVPTLLIVGDGDLREQVTLVDTLATKIPGAQKAVMHGVAHLPNMERPAEFNRLVLDFLKAL